MVLLLGGWLAVRFKDVPEDEASFFISLANNILTLRGQKEPDVDEGGLKDLIQNVVSLSG